MDGALLPRPAPADDPMVPRTFRIERRAAEVDGCFTLTLKATDGRPFAFQPGQFNMLYVFGVGEVAISVSGDCRDLNTLTHTIREVGTVTRAMAKLRVGDVIGVRGPFGRPWPIAEAYGNDILFVTGTVGLAPLRPLIYEVLNRREHFGKVVICYGSRGTHDILYEKQLHQWRGRFDLQVHVTVHSAPSGYRGRVGSVANLVKIARFDPDHTTAYVCRSETMTRPAVQALHDRGITSDRIYVTLERNMKCGVGFCGHCQMGPSFMCKDGPVYRYDTIEDIFTVREL
ncbi:NAD(P)H-flavin reductase [Azospirillum fermentarium]|uniref:FAD/NAD(P)-binding protein n=1 Tax=Azospirillum fermentarium TaxID=1233114 RepID=UPI002225E581|nr:FAD/NAD(P)-binding protein [Azospirillum fermentarium]MCW2247910.1 NAD(P)H-flavin reductase [Azospirillum fermentarium]